MYSGSRSKRLALAGITLLAAAAAIRHQRRRFGATVQRHVDVLLAEARPPAGDQPDGDPVFSSADLDGLPAPVRRYFDRVLDEGQPHVRTARFRQRGEFRLGGADAAWRPMTATQHVAVRPPGFVWDATIDVAPFFPARVLDAYRDGEGLLRARLRSAVPVARAGPDPATNEAELLRYLAEGVWYPTALLPAAGVEWEPVDGDSARATLTDGAVTASAVFQFAADGTVERVTAQRYRQEDDSSAPWVGYYRDYARRNGMLIPTAAEVAWDLPAGELTYWRATIHDIEHATVGP